MTKFFVPHTTSGNRGFIAGLLEVHSDTFYQIVPLGDERQREFYSERPAVQLSEAHAHTANRLGIAALPHAVEVR